MPKPAALPNGSLIINGLNPANESIIELNQFDCDAPPLRSADVLARFLREGRPPCLVIARLGYRDVIPLQMVVVGGFCLRQRLGECEKISIQLTVLQLFDE